MATGSNKIEKRYKLARCRMFRGRPNLLIFPFIWVQTDIFDRCCQWKHVERESPKKKWRTNSCQGNKKLLYCPGTLDSVFPELNRLVSSDFPRNAPIQFPRVCHTLKPRLYVLGVFRFNDADYYQIIWLYIKKKYMLQVLLYNIMSFIACQSPSIVSKDLSQNTPPPPLPAR